MNVSTVQVVCLAIAIVVVIIVYRKVSRLAGGVRALFDMMDVFSFEWKPIEEIGKRVHASKSAAIIAFIDRFYLSDREENESREDFCKRVMRGVFPIFEEVGTVEVSYIAPTDVRLEECAHLLRELSAEEIETYKQRWARVVGDGHVLTIDICERKVVGSGFRPMNEEEVDSIARLFGIVLVRKKPGGKRPPRLSKKSARQVMTGLVGVGSPA